MVIVHSLVSRSYVLDLYPGNSAVEFMLKEGLDVFLLDWGVPDEADAGNTLEHYVDQGIPDAIAAACEAAGTDEVTVLGYCFGGVLSLISAARHPDMPIRNLALMATPVDFTKMETITALVRDGRLDPDEVVEPTGNVPPDVIENGFRLLKPTAEVSQYANLWENLWNDEFMEGYQAMGQWARDHIPFPGAAFAQTTEQLVRRNALMEGTLELGGERVDLGAITRPVLNIMAERDHIVPLAAAEPLSASSARRTRRSCGCRPGTRASWRAARRRRSRCPTSRAGSPTTARRRDGDPQPHSGDLDALLGFFERVPESERTFFKEPVLDRSTVEGWLTERPRAPRPRLRRGRPRRRLRRGGAASGWSDHVGDVRLVVDPQRRTQGLGRALARWALLQAVECGMTKLTVEVVAEQERAVAMFSALGFRAEGLLLDHVRDHDGVLRDLVLLSHPVADSWSAMETAGIDDALRAEGG